MTHQQVIQTMIRQYNIPNQCIPLLVIFIIAKTPTVLLAGFVLGYFMLSKQDNEKTTKRIKALPQPPLITAPRNSLEYDNEPHYASINHSALIQEEDDISNASIDFENLLKFPSCPTTLPRLDTHFNFVSDDHHQLQQNNSIDWSAIHQELEYDEQRSAKAPTVVIQKEPQHPLYISPSQNDMLTFSSASSSSSEDADVSSLLSLESTTMSRQTTMTSPKTPLPPHDNSTAAILLVDQPDHQTLVSSSSAATTSFTSHINNMALLDDILLLPSSTPLPKPSLSSPGQLFKSKFQKAVNKMKKSNSNSGDNSSNSRRSSTYSQDSFINTGTQKASSLQIQSYIPQPHGSPRPSASARLNGHLKGRFNKLFKK